MSTKTLDEPVQDRLRLYLQRCIDADTQGVVAKRFGVAQSHISSFINKRSGAGSKLLLGIADVDPTAFANVLLGRDVAADDPALTPDALAARLLVEDAKGSTEEVEAARTRALEVFGDEGGATTLAWVRRIEPLIETGKSTHVRPKTGKTVSEVVKEKKG